MQNEITVILAPLTEARPVVFSLMGEEGIYTFPAATPAKAAQEIADMLALGFDLVSASYADAPGASSPSVPTFAHDEAGDLV